jgi:hypothetical protein
MNEQPTNQVRAALVGGLFAILTACLSGAFLIVNTLIQNGIIIVGPSLQVGLAGETSQAVQTEVPATAEPPGAGQAGERKQPDARADSFEAFVRPGKLLCLASGSLAIENIDRPVEFAPEQGVAVACWIGPQRARAQTLPEPVTKQEDLAGQNPDQAALSLALDWGREVAAQSGDCRPDRPDCQASAVAVVRADGSVLQP